MGCLWGQKQRTETLSTLRLLASRHSLALFSETAARALPGPDACLCGAAESAWKALVYCGLVALELYVSVNEKCAETPGFKISCCWRATTTVADSRASVSLVELQGISFSVCLRAALLLSSHFIICGLGI